MKKFFIGSFALLAVAAGMNSCNNGAYDAQPNDPNALNPLNENSGVSVYLGNIVVDVNDTKTGFYPSYFRRDTTEGSNNRMIEGHRVKDPQRHTIQIYINNFKNVKEFISGITYSFIDTVREDSVTAYWSAPESIEVKILGEEDGHLRGTFQGTVYPVTPFDHLPDSIVLENGEFYVPHKPW